MEEAGLDALLATSKHSIQYLLGGYRFFFYDYMDAHGLSRYLPFFVYVKGRPLDSGYVGAPMERYEKQLGSFWVTNLDLKNDASTGYAGAAAEILKSVGAAEGRVGIEAGFMPLDAFRVLEAQLPGVELTDATYTLEVLRALKTPEELEILKEASEKVVDSMLAVFSEHGPGTSKLTLFDALRRGRDGARHQVRVRADERRDRLQPRALRQGLGGRRDAGARFRRQLPGLHRRRLPHGLRRGA